MRNIELAWFKGVEGWSLTVNMSKAVLAELHDGPGYWGSHVEGAQVTGAGHPKLVRVTLNVVPDEHDEIDEGLRDASHP